MPAPNKMHFRDLVTRNRAAAQALKNDLKDLNARMPRTDAEREQLGRLSALVALGDDALVDPLFINVKDAFNDDCATTLGVVVEDHEHGTLKFGEAGKVTLSD